MYSDYSFLNAVRVLEQHIASVRALKGIAEEQALNA